MEKDYNNREIKHSKILNILMDLAHHNLGILECYFAIEEHIENEKRKTPK